jgi:putative copper resistance protein D
MSNASVQRRLPRTPLLVLGGAALLACLVAIVVGGAAKPSVTGLPDPGAFVRWGLPIARVIHDGAAALTIGLLLLATSAIPDRAGEALAKASKWAVASGMVWIAAGLTVVVLGFADVAGVAPTAPGFTTQLLHFVWSLETLREGLISSLLVAIAITVVSTAHGRAATAWGGILSVIALFPLALAGHNAATVEHETAVNTLAFHLVGAAVWVGCLAALALLRPSLGKWFAVVVERFSKIATWCLITVALSGIVSAVVRLTSFGNLETAYGALIIAKVVALVLLGVVGLAQRRKVVATIRKDPQSGSAFARLAVVELVVMGVAFGVATALARSANPDAVRPAPATMAEQLTNYPEPAAPDSMSWLTLWRWDWLWGTVSIVAILLYVGSVVRLHRRGDRWPVGRTICWVLGFIALIWATSGAPGVYGRVSFSWHMTSHMVIAMVIPIFLVLSAPVTLIMRVEPHRKDGTYGTREIILGLVHSRYLAFFANPVVAGLNFTFGLVIFYYSGLFQLALETHTGHIIMVVHFLLAGYLFVMVLIGVDPGPPKWSAPMRLVVLFATISFHSFFGVAMINGTTLLAGDFFRQIHIPWIPDLVSDQQHGGAIAWGIGDVPSIALAMLLMLAWVRSDRLETRRLDRQADRDHDADLTAYNAQLAALSALDARVEAAEHRASMPREKRATGAAGAASGTSGDGAEAASPEPTSPTPGRP